MKMKMKREEEDLGVASNELIVKINDFAGCGDSFICNACEKDDRMHLAELLEDEGILGEIVEIELIDKLKAEDLLLGLQLFARSQRRGRRGGRRSRRRHDKHFVSLSLPQHRGRVRHSFHRNVVVLLVVMVMKGMEMGLMEINVTEIDDRIDVREGNIDKRSRHRGCVMRVMLLVVVVGGKMGRGRVGMKGKERVDDLPDVSADPRDVVPCGGRCGGVEERIKVSVLEDLAGRWNGERPETQFDDVKLVLGVKVLRDHLVESLSHSAHAHWHGHARVHVSQPLLFPFFPSLLLLLPVAVLVVVFVGVRRKGIVVRIVWVHCACVCVVAWSVLTAFGTRLVVCEVSGRVVLRLPCRERETARMQGKNAARSEWLAVWMEGKKEAFRSFFIFIFIFKSSSSSSSSLRLHLHLHQVFIKSSSSSSLHLHQVFIKS